MDFSKKGVIRKQKQLVSKLPRNKRKLSVSAFKAVLVIFLGLIVAGMGAGFGMLKGILDDTPEVKAEDLIPTGYQTTIVDSEGKPLQTLANFDSNREYVYFNEIPTDLVNAFVAIEDERFWEHNGIDVQGILRAAIQTLSGDKQGASTLTQQLIKNKIFNVGLNEDTMLDTVERKIQEQYLAVEVEKKLSKEEIAEYYLNTIYLGQGRYGVQTAAEYYFGKELNELTISESAVLASITQNPSKYDPIVFPEKNAKRRLSVLKNMKEQGYIDQVQYDEALADDVYAEIATIDNNRSNEPEEVNSYYIDEVINQLEDDFMAQGHTKAEADNMIYSGGLTVKICQDAQSQSICDEVLNDDSNYPSGKYLLSYALTLTDDEGTEYNYSQNQMVKWFKEEKGQSSFDLLFRDADEAREAADQYKAALIADTGYTFLLESYNVTIQPQISFTLIEQSTGQVKAIVGGRGTKNANRAFDRASEATRQPGSTFKVLASFLPALEACKMTLATSYDDAPYTYANGRPVKNWYGGYRGLSTMREAIKNSMNIIAVKFITDVTPQVSYEYLKKLGFSTIVEQRTEADGSIVSDLNQAMALGGLTDGVTNLEITGAYATIANKGQYIKPIFYTEVYDHNGNLIIDNRAPEGEYVISEQNAWLLTSAMQDVVSSGTGTLARLTTGMTVAGKTGTTSNNYDAWFCGFTPYYTASIWIGYDTNTAMSGSYHKIMWRKIMDEIVKAKNQDTSASFKMPDGIVKATVCKESGLLPSGGCPTITEYFAEGTVPKKRCDQAGQKTITLCDESHMKCTDNCPHTTKYSYTVDENGNIVIEGATFAYDNSILNSSCTLHPADEDTGEFKISSSSGKGGSISESVSVAEGSSATFYILAAEGYAISDVLVDGSSVGPVSSYTFNNINGNHTIKALFVASSTSTTEKPTTEKPTTEKPTTEKPTTEKPTTEKPTTETTDTEAATP